MFVSVLSNGSLSFIHAAGLSLLIKVVSCISLY